MNNKLKNVLLFVTGTAVGATGATLYLRKFYNDLIDNTLTEQINQEMDAIKEEYQAKLNKIAEDLKANKDEVVNDLKEKYKEKVQTKNPVSKKTKSEKKEETVDYTKYSEGKKKGKKVVDERTEAIKEIIADKTNPDNGSVIIEFEDYTENNGYDKVTATYFAGDDAYIDDYDKPDLELGAIIGDLITKIEDYGVGDSLYVRNDDLKTDYEIIFNKGLSIDYLTNNG